MEEVSDPAALRRLLSGRQCNGQAIGLVPTMGYLHAGHLRLIQEARNDNDCVVLSIFVNPTQFGPNEDFERYPRDLQHDRALAHNNGVDIVFAPTVEAMYPNGAAEQSIWIDPGALAAGLCGATRPGHFRGVATVVTKLLNMVAPARTYVGQKDAQQAMIISRLVADLAFPTEVRVVPTVREGDGLALSSRNVYLTREQRARATALYRALAAARSSIAAGERSSPQIEQTLRTVIEDVAPDARIDYASVVALNTLHPWQDQIQGDTLVAAAVYVGSTRLIDNLIVRFGEQGVTFT